MTSNLASDLSFRPEMSDPSFVSVCAMVSVHAAVEPNRLAVAAGNRRLTYAELERQSDELAAHLGHAGVGPGSCVGLFVARSPQFVVAAYAVLKAGAAYLPLDPATPRSRAAFILADADASVVLTDSRSAGLLPAGAWRVVELDEKSMAARPAAPVGIGAAPEGLAYVIYTSGSTGRPKGVELTQANLVNLVDWHITSFGVTANDRASQVAGVGFDAAVWEIWPHLAAGASVHIADEATRRSPHLLRDWLVAEKITIGFVPTVLAEQLIHVSWPEETALRTLLTGADVLHRRPMQGLPFSVVNNYGPTECTVVATSGSVEPYADKHTTPSIGRPIANTTALVLDDSLRSVAPGEPGELCLAGALVGRGYRNDPELTASRFVTVDQSSGPPLRVYRTGDQVRFLASGEIAFLGRLDKQVKIRGFRVEPSEIVAWLDRYPEVEASAVVARLDGDPAEDLDADLPDRLAPELVAYVVVGENSTISSAQLREFLAARVPEYMVPAKFVGIDSLPMTLNGKLDESLLPAPTADNLLEGQLDTADGVGDGTVEEHLAVLVKGMLKLPSLDGDENIFLAGGHSMFAMQLVSRIRQDFGVKLTLRQVFSQPTVVGLAAAVTRQTPVNTAGAHLHESQ